MKSCAMQRATNKGYITITKLLNVTLDIVDNNHY